MADTVEIKVRIDASLKGEAVRILHGYGLTMTAALRMVLEQIVREKAVPAAFDIANARSAEARQSSVR